MKIHLLTITIFACFSPNAPKKVETQTKDSTGYVSNIKLVNGKIVIDSNAILNNTNLKWLIEDLEKSELSEKKSMAELPVFLKSFLDSLTGNFRIADPGQDWQAGCTGSFIIIDKKVKDKTTIDSLIQISQDRTLPRRQLIYLGVGSDIALMTYYSGGIGKTEHVLIFKFDSASITDFWCGTIHLDKVNKQAIINYLRKNKDRVWGLNTNCIYL